MADMPEEIAGKLDGLLKPTAEPENAVLMDNARLVRWAGPAFALCSLALIPWTVYLGYSLPARQASRHYNLAWVGFDVMLLLVLGATGLFAFRRSRYLALAAAAGATMLVVDAWFDVLTSPRREVLESLLMAVFVELPLAGVCAWLSYHTEQLEGKRISLLLAHRFRRG
jgi:hypothetical protein